jgi:hypothetical protein
MTINKNKIKENKMKKINNKKLRLLLINFKCNVLRRRLKNDSLSQMF